MMSKPSALTDAQIAEIEDRMRRDWPIRRHHIEPLIAMARERNQLVAEKMTAGAVKTPTVSWDDWYSGGILP